MISSAQSGRLCATHEWDDDRGDIQATTRCQTCVLECPAHFPTVFGGIHVYPCSSVFIRGELFVSALICRNHWGRRHVCNGKGNCKGAFKAAVDSGGSASVC